MKILLTGSPGVGKSSIVEKVMDLVPKCTGILAREYRKEGDRVGFIAENRRGEAKQFMRKTDKQLKDSIGQPGNWYAVDVRVIDTFVVPELEQASRVDGAVLCIDEIGRAQMLSSAFNKLVKILLLNPQQSLLATIVYADDPHSPSLEFKRYPNVCLLEVTRKNRDALPAILTVAFKQADLFKKLDSERQRKVFKLLKQFVENEYYISAEKMFTNALDYSVSNRLTLLEEKNSISQYVVRGKTREHKVNYHRDTNVMDCDCELSTGSGCYAGCAQMCSHQIAVLLIDTISAPVNGLFTPRSDDRVPIHNHQPPHLMCRSRL